MDLPTYLSTNNELTMRKQRTHHARATMRATERRSERAASKETTKHIWHVLPDK